MAECCVVADCKQRRGPAAELIRRQIPDRVDALVFSDEPPACEPVLDSPRRYPSGEQLSSRDAAPLPTSEVRDQLIVALAENVDISPSSGEVRTFFGHAPTVAGRKSPFNPSSSLP